MASKAWSLTIAILAGVLVGMANLYSWHFLVWICFVPIFVLMSGRKKLLAFVVGFIAGIVQYYNISDIVAAYAGGHSMMEYIVALGLKASMALKIGVLSLLFAYSFRPRALWRIPQSIIQSVFVASAVVSFEFLLSFVIDGVPLLDYPIGSALAGNCYAAQWAEFGGVYALSFLVIFTNSLLALAIMQKKRNHALVALGLVAFVYMFGYFRSESIDAKAGKEVKIAILNDNSSPDLRWKKENLNKYATSLLKLARQGANMRPDLIVWNEGAVPWAFSPDDDLFREITKITRNLGIWHLLSYFTTDAVDSTKSYNSAYFIDSSGAVAGRYDKSVLLRGMEQPLLGSTQSGWLKLPFFSESQFSYLENNNPQPIQTDWGKIGVLICNESMTDEVASALAGKGAGALILISNDNWIAHSAFAEIHFLSAKLRAIENRKPIVINSNLGYSGIIDRSGKVIVSDKSTSPKAILCSIYLDGSGSNYLIYKYILLALCLVGAVGAVWFFRPRLQKYKAPTNDAEDIKSC